ncbi:sigma-70 family RNA polymerase sigma factor [Sandaracinus amylolyticus]|uniref:Putative DNA-binding regulatory protein n=1 Tax=Sandaracinus amylolyticus TaxID=927083 RepID=A0A0F6SDV9_9BACT|nr:sigma-70 family RNA polymerase sigma factor [Sandaracinus amylolyticus]AKF04124.1 putative DNA-binding regulatory protein [Sandaracinus amylolyticus]
MSLAAIYRALRPELDDPDLDARLDAMCAAADAALERPCDRDALVRALAALSEPPARWTEAGAGELAIALACAAGDERAVRRFESLYLVNVPQMLAHMKLSESTLDEVVQRVREKLLVGAPPRIVEYAGLGRLPGLIKVTAVRTALTLVRDARRDVHDETAVLELPAEHDPELAFLAHAYRGAFREAFASAVAELDPRERNLLRLHFLDRVTLDRLATMYAVHRATIVRQLAAARAKLAERTEAALRARLHIRPDELASVMDLIRSRMDASVDRLLESVDHLD